MYLPLRQSGGYNRKHKRICLFVYPDFGPPDDNASGGGQIRDHLGDESCSVLSDQERTFETCPSVSSLDQIISSSPLETKSCGELLGQIINAKKENSPHSSQSVVIGLIGELGAGKTTFTQGLARGLGVQARITSPTFTLINEYITPAQDVRLFHVDSYRLAVETADPPNAATGRAGRAESLANQVYGLGMDEIFDLVEEDSFGLGGALWALP